VRAGGNLSGRECALLSLPTWNSHDDNISALAIFGGFINPQIIRVSLLYAARCGRLLRSVLAVTILLCVRLTWIAIAQMSFAGMSMRIGPGHVLWIVGILLTVLPELPFRFLPSKAA
jgi:hypothetical protein